MELFDNREINELLQSAQIGLWKVEIKEGMLPRFYTDSVMDELLGIDPQTDPEERYQIHHKCIHADDLSMFEDYSDKLAEERAEVVYRYIHPQKGEMYVRCNGMRDDSIRDYVCLKGTHQDISDTIRLEQDKIAEQRLAEENLVLKKDKGYSERMYSMLMKLQTCGIVAYKLPSHEVLVMNDMAKRLYDLDVDNDVDQKDIFQKIKYVNNLLNVHTKEKLKQMHRPGNQISYTLRIPHRDGKTLHVFATTGLIQMGNGDNIVISSLQDISKITSIQETNRRLQEQADEITALNERLKSEQIELKNQYSFMEAMSSDVLDIFLLDLKAGTSTTIKTKGFILPKEERPTRPYEETWKGYISKYVHQDDQDRLRKFVEIKNIIDALKNNKQIQCNYRIIIEQQIYNYQSSFTYVGEIDAGMIAFGFRCIDDIVQAEQEQIKYERQLLMDLKMLMAAIDTVYPRVMEVNLTRNTFKLLIVDELSRVQSEYTNQFDDMISFTAALVPDDGQREEYLRLFEREKQIEAFNRGEKSISHIHQMLDMDGELHWMNTQVIFLGDRTKDITQVAFSRCIDDDMEKQEKLHEAIRASEAANKAKTMFLNNMSHDIRTPMNAILGFAGLIHKKIDDPDAINDYLNKIEESGNYLLSIINSVLDMARIDSGKLELKEDIIDISEVKDGYLELLSLDIERKNLKFEYGIKVSHRYVYGDSVRLNQIFINLLSNAVKYTPVGGRIRFMVEELPGDREDFGTYMITVEDTGIGMSKDFQEQLFDSFTRERTSTESKVMGTGLGMSIVKRIVDIMGGNIEVESEVGKGSTFRVSFSLEIVEDLSDDCELVENNMQEEDYDFTGKRILLAEDNDLNAEIAMEILSMTGIEVDWAEDGVICLQKLEKAEDGYFDLILMDIQMPNMDGYHATERIRKMENKGKASLPIIAMTANAFSEDKKAAKAAGMNDHLAKPIEVEKLMKTLKKYI